MVNVEKSDGNSEEIWQRAHSDAAYVRAGTVDQQPPEEAVCINAALQDPNSALIQYLVTLNSLLARDTPIDWDKVEGSACEDSVPEIEDASQS